MTQTDAIYSPCSSSLNNMVEAGDNHFEALRDVAEFLSFFQAQLLRPQESNPSNNNMMAAMDSKERGSKRKYQERNEENSGSISPSATLHIPTLAGGTRSVTRSELLHRVKPITPQTLQRVLRSRLSREQESQEKESTSTADACDPFDDYVNILLDRLEVWGTKALTQNEFSRLQPSVDDLSGIIGYYSDSSIDKITPNVLALSASSTLLGLPDGRLMAKYLPAVKLGNAERHDDGHVTRSEIHSMPLGDKPMPTKKMQQRQGDKANKSSKDKQFNLLIPPNSLTWKEYLRICHMLSQISSPSLAKEIINHLTQCHNSSSTWFDQVLHDTHNWTRGELLITWVRAQRNTAALRLLLHAFEFHEVNDTCAASNGRSNKKIVAAFRGNTKLTRTKVKIESDLVEMLVEFVVMNHYLNYTVSPSPSSNTTTTTSTGQDKRDSVKAPSLVHNGNTNSGVTEAVPTKLLQLFIFRWFVRRNQPYLFFTFLSPESSLLDIPELSMVEQRELFKIVQTKRKNSEHCLAQIDHNIAEGEYNSTDEFRDAVISLLSDFLSCCPQKGINLRTGLKKAIDDLRWMLDEFATSEELHRFIIYIHGNNNDDIADVTSATSRFHKKLSDNLKYLPAPWIHDLCPSCPQGGLSRKNADYSTLGGHSGVICGVCGKTLHKWSSRSFARVRGARITDHTPLQKIFCARIPSFENPEDFASNISWEKISITIKRNPSQSGALPNWGMIIDHTQDCMGAYEKIMSLTWNPYDPHDPYAEILPVFIPKDIEGMIVKDFCPDSIALRSGIQSGDVVTNVYTLDRSLADSLNPQGIIVRKYDLKKISMEEREDLFFQKYTELSLIIQRPSKNIVEFAKKWRSLAEQSVRSIKGVVGTEFLPDYWCCSDCSKSKSLYCCTAEVSKQRGEGIFSENSRRLEQAAMCCALIRRLSFEWYSVPFIDETHTDEKVIGLQCVSLRRIELMMRDILKSGELPASGKDMSSMTDAENSDHSFPIIGPFYVIDSSHGSSNQRVRVTWALDDDLDPIDLLCRAMCEFLRSPIGKDPYEMHRRRMATCFVSLFQHHFIEALKKETLCEAVKEEKEECSTRFLEKDDVNFMPWSLNICRVCGVRSCSHSGKKSKKYSVDCCDHSSCLSVMNSFNNSGEKAEADEYCSTVIGSTILALPGDSVLSDISEALQVPLDHQGRLVELIVVSYHDICSKSHGNFSDHKEPYFYLFPILYYKVMQRLLSNVDLALDDLERLPGVVKVTYLELHEMLDRTISVFFALDIAVRNICADGPKNQVRASEGDETHFSVTSTSTNSELSDTPNMEVEKKLLLTKFTYSEHLKSLPCKYNFLFYHGQDVCCCEYWSALVDSLSAGNIDSIRGFLDVSESVRCSSPVCDSEDVLLDGDGNTSIGESDTEATTLDVRRRKQTRLQNPSYRKIGLPNLAAGLVCVYSDVELSEKTPIPNSSEFNPDEYYDSGSFMCATLQRSTCSDSMLSADENIYSGMGWGMLLVQCSNSDIRVGYLSPNSPAGRLLRVHDLILKVNGLEAKELESSGMLSTALLCLPGKLASSEQIANNDRLCSIKKDLENLSSPCTGPVVLEILRPKMKEAPRHTHTIRPREKDAFSAEKSPTFLKKPMTENLGHEDKSSTANTLNQRLSHLTLPSDYWHSKPTSIMVTNVNESQLKSIHLELNRSDLYRQGFPGSILTRVETSILLHCFKLNSPLLGLRLLSPRYPKNVVRADYDTYISGPARLNPLEIPSIPDKFWALIIQADYKRSLSEIGPVIFNEHGYSYRSPHQVLPLDRLMESVVKKSENNASHEKEAYHSAPAEAERRWLTSAVNCPTGESHNIFQPTYSLQQLPLNSNIFSGRAVAVAGPPEVIDLVDTDESEAVQLSCNNHTDQDISRIRGGGKTVYLIDLDRSMWKNQFVVGQCQTTLGSTRTGLAKFIGRVFKPADDPCVDVFYVSNGGFLNPTVKRIVSATKLQIATATDEKKIVDEAIVRYYSIGARISETENKFSAVDTPNESLKPVPSTAANATNSQSTETASFTALGKVTQTSHDLSSFDIRTFSFDFFRRLLRRTNQATPLGFLPDGRALCWIQSDPKALYIRDLEASRAKTLSFLEFTKRQQDFKAILDRNGRRHKLYFDGSKKYYCLWGCTVPRCNSQGCDISLNLSQAMAFEDTEGYQAHANLSHNFGSCTNSRHKMWLRIHEGCDIQRICQNLTSAVCLRCTEMTSFAASFPPRMKDTAKLHPSSEVLMDLLVFDERLLHKMSTERDTLSFSNLPRFLDRATKDLIRLWSRIYRLFSVEDNGFFRFSNNDLYNHYVVTNGVAVVPKNVSEDAPNVTPRSLSVYQTCRCFNGLKPGHIECVHCPLCLGIDECAVSANLEKDESLEASVSEIVGIGCSLFSSLFIENNNLVRDNKQNISWKPHDNVKLTLDVLKNLFITVAIHVPPLLRKSGNTGKTSKKTALGSILILNHSIWENEGTLKLWSEYVMACLNARMLAQAFLVLLRSVIIEKMPKWWKAAKIGWCRGVAVLLQNPDFSSLAFQLFVFDAAVTNVLASELCAVAIKDKTSKNTGNIVEEPNFERVPLRKNIEEMAAYVGEDVIKESMKHLNKVAIQDRMKTIFQWAKRLSVTCFDGEHNGSCVKCDDGGNLMCCEFCNQVQHCKCCSPPLAKIPDFDWACDDCVCDISTFYLFLQATQDSHPISETHTNDHIFI